jgi:ABC-type Fe3+/spermidine/putrescine transport system ATPase subunit
LASSATVASDTDPVKRRLGLVPQDLALYDELTARTNLRLFGSLDGLSGPTLNDAIEVAAAVLPSAATSRPTGMTTVSRCSQAGKMNDGTHAPPSMTMISTAKLATRLMASMR